MCNFSLSIHLLTDTLGYFHVLIVVNNAAVQWTTGRRNSVSFQGRGQIFFGIWENEDNVSLWSQRWVGQFAVPLKDVGFLNSGFLCCNINPLCAQYLPGPLRISLKYLRNKGTNSSLKLMLLAMPWVIKSFVSDPGLWCLLWHLWNLLPLLSLSLCALSHSVVSNSLQPHEL